MPEDALADFRRLADDLPLFVWTQRADGFVDWANRRWYDFARLPREIATRSEGWVHVVHPDDYTLLICRLAEAVAGRSPLEIELRLKPADADGYRWFLVRSEPRFESDGSLAYWLGTAVDIDASRSRSAEAAQAFRAIAEGIPEMLWTATADGQLDWHNRRWYEYTGLRSDDGTGAQWSAVMCPDDLEQVADGWTFAVRSGTFFETTARMRRHDGVYRWFLNRASPERDEHGEIVRWCGTSVDVDDARRVAERERRIARTFQDAAMLSALPSIPGLRFDAIYEAAQAEATVGGDWYDAVRLPDGRVVLSVGDVSGNGLDAAVTMGSVRQSIRTAALINPDPVAVLDAVDRIVRAMGHERFVTAFVGVLDPVSFEMRYASAGHPPPLVRGPDGSIARLASGDLPLGLRHRTGGATREFQFAPGSVLLAFTDGLTEFDRDAVSGEFAANQALAAVRDDAIAHAVYESITHGRPARDDVAILAVALDAPISRVGGGRYAQTWTFLAGDAEAGCCARRDIANRLRAHGLPEHDVISSELVFAELIGNVVRYAPGTAEVTLDVSGDAPVLHVIDYGEGFELLSRLPTDLLSERGRGLYLVGAIAEEFSVERRSDGGSHARAVLAARPHSASPTSLMRDTLV